MRNVYADAHGRATIGGYFEMPAAGDGAAEAKLSGRVRSDRAYLTVSSGICEGGLPGGMLARYATMLAT